MDSSSSAEVDLLNPEVACRRLVSLVVEHADGTEEAIPAGGVAIAAGANMEFTIADDDDEILWDVVSGEGGEDPYFRAKYNGLIGIVEGSSATGEGSGDDQPDWLFTDETLYITQINGVLAEALSGVVFMLGGDCATFGGFEAAAGYGYPEEPSLCEVPDDGSSSSAEAVLVPCSSALTIIDICTPCLDCLHYYRMEEYLDRIQVFYDYIFALAYDNTTTSAEIPEHPDGGIRETFTGSLQQFMSSLRYWDYLVHNSTIKLSAQSFGQSVVAAAFYRNISDFTVGAGGGTGVTMTLTFDFQKVDSGGVLTAWDGIASSISDVRILDREGRCSAILGVTGVTFPNDHTVVVETISSIDLVSGAEIYSDVALVLLGTILTNDPLFSYQVAVNLLVSHTHLGLEAAANPVERNTIVYFRPPDPGSSA